MLERKPTKRRQKCRLASGPRGWLGRAKRTKSGYVRRGKGRIDERNGKGAVADGLLGPRPTIPSDRRARTGDFGGNGRLLVDFAIVSTVSKAPGSRGRAEAVGGLAPNLLKGRRCLPDPEWRCSKRV